MEAAGLADVVWLLVGLAVIAAACTFSWSIVARRKKRRARGFFVLGFICGVTAGVMLKRRRRTFQGLRPVLRWLGVRRRIAGIYSGAEYFPARALTTMTFWRRA
jgi:hypothetical protein